MPGLDVKYIAGQLPTVRGGGRTQSMAELTEITIHKTDADTSTPQSTATYHVRDRGWPHIAYHFYIAKDGTVFQTLPYTTVGCHAPPNRGRLGIVLVGKCSDPPTEAQARVLPQLVQELRQTIPTIRTVRGHSEAMPGHTDCPGPGTLALIAALRVFILALLLCSAACGGPAPGSIMPGQPPALGLAKQRYAWPWAEPRTEWYTFLRNDHGQAVAGLTPSQHMIKVVWPGSDRISDSAYLHELLHAAVWQATGHPDTGHSLPVWADVPLLNSRLAAAGF